MTVAILFASLAGLLCALVAVAVALRNSRALATRCVELEAARTVAEAATARARASASRERAAALRASEPRSWWDGQRRHQLMVHLTDDTTIRGVVLEVTEDGVLLTACEYLGERTLPLGGEVFIARDRVAFTQVPPRSVNGAGKR